MTTYERLTMEDPDEEEDSGRTFSNSTTSSDIEVDNVTSHGYHDEKTSTERQLLLPSDDDLHKAHNKRKAQLLKVTLVAVVCLLQTVALPVFYGESENYWGEESMSGFLSAKYSLYGCFILSCMFAPMLIAMFGIKVILVSGSVSACIFVSANFIPLEYSAVPASVVSGLTMGPFIVVQGVFITNCAYRYCSSLTSCDKDAIINITNGLFFMIALSAPVLLSAFKLLFLDSLKLNMDNNGGLAPANVSTAGCADDSCPFSDGYKNELFILPDSENQEDYKFSYHRIQALLGSKLAMAFTGLIISALMFNSNHPVISHLRKSRCSEPPEHFKWTPNSKQHNNAPCRVALKEHFSSGLLKWSSVFSIIKDTKISLVLPLFLYLGMQQGVVYNVFIKDFVGCRLDRERVYFMRMLTATCSVLTSLPVAILARYVGRFRLSLPAMAVQLSLTLTMLLWQPGLDQWGVLFVVGALWGCADAVWHVLTSALIGRLFRAQKDAAFSQLRLCQMLGILTIDILRSALCTTIVLAIFLLMLTCAMASFIAFEIWVRIQLKANHAKSLNNGHLGSEVSPSSMSLDLDKNLSWVPGLSPHENRERVALDGSRRVRQQ